MTSRRREKPRSPGHKTERQLDLIFHALSDPTRRALLAHLVQGPATVNMLVAPFAISRPAVSKHLRVLEEACLIRRDIDGRLHHCALSVAPLRQVEQFLAVYRPFWESTLEKLAGYVERDRHA